MATSSVRSALTPSQDRLDRRRWTWNRARNHPASTQSTATRPGYALDKDVGKSDTGVVKNDMKVRGTIAPPRRSEPPTRAGTQVSMPNVRSRSVAELEEDFAGLLANRPGCALSEIADDGSPRVASLVSVWILSQVGNAVGKPKFVNLSNVRREELRSIGGVARLVHRTLHPVPAVSAS
jgi:hypothetical protein